MYCCNADLLAVTVTITMTMTVAVWHMLCCVVLFYITISSNLGQFLRIWPGAEVQAGVGAASG